MELKHKAMLTAVALAVSFGGLFAGAGPASAVSCPDNGWSRLDSYTDSFSVSGVNMRTGPSTSCPSVGQGQLGQVVTLHCYKYAPGLVGWDHVYNQATGKSGWVRSIYLTELGSIEPC